MNNRNFPPRPFPMLSPEVLAQMAAAAFRPPPLMSAPQMPSMSRVPPSLSLRDGFALLNQGLDQWRERQRAAPRLQFMEGAVNAPVNAQAASLRPLPGLDFLTGQWNPKGGFSA